MLRRADPREVGKPQYWQALGMHRGLLRRWRLPAHVVWEQTLWRQRADAVCIPQVLVLWPLLLAPAIQRAWMRGGYRWHGYDFLQALANRDVMSQA